MSIKGSSRQSFREVSETIPGLKSRVKRGSGEKSTDAGGTGQALMARAGGAQGNLLNVLFKQANAQTLTAEEMQRLIEPGRLIPLIPFYAEIQRIRETIETVPEDLICL